MSDGRKQNGALRVAVQLRNRLYREVIGALLDREPDLQIVGTTAFVTEVAQLCGLRDPDVVILDAGPAQADLAELVGVLHSSHPGVHIVGLYETPDPGMAERLMRAGVSNLVSGAGGAAALLTAVRRPMWRSVTGPQAIGRLARLLTDRELRVLHLIGSGYTLAQIAEALRVTPRTVENYKRRIFAKLDAHSQAHAAAYAVRFGLLRPDTLHGQRKSESVRPDVPAVGLLCGQAGNPADRVAELLLRRRIPLIIDRSRELSSLDHPVRHTRGVLIAVLVDPQATDWPSWVDASNRPLVVMSHQPCQAETVEVILRGASALITTDQLEQTLIPAFDLVASGYLLVDAVQVRKFIGAGYARMAGMHPFVPLELTKREQQILTCIERGNSVKQTARALGISLKTVESLQSRLFRKLGIHSRAEALVVAYGLGLMPLSERKAED